MSPSIAKLSFVSFFLGLVSKLFHLPFHTILLLIAILGLLIFYGHSTWRSQLDRTTLLCGWASTAWLLVLLFALKFWPFSSAILIVASGLTVWASISVWRSRAYKKAILPLVCLGLGLSTFMMPSDIRYHTVSIRWNHEIKNDFYSWYKYSWFLYVNGKEEQALEASSKALTIAEELGEDEWVSIIQKNHQLILSLDSLRSMQPSSQ
jgi:hypothetical protein